MLFAGKTVPWASYRVETIGTRCGLNGSIVRTWGAAVLRPYRGFDASEAYCVKLGFCVGRDKIWA